jgi:hypothetical protein
MRIVLYVCLALACVFFGFMIWMCLVLATPVPPDYYGDERDYPYYGDDKTRPPRPFQGTYPSPHAGLHQQENIDE